MRIKINSDLNATLALADRILAEIDAESKEAHEAAGYDTQGWDSCFRLLDPAADDLDDDEREIVADNPGAAAILTWQGEFVVAIPAGASEDQIRRTLREQVTIEPPDNQ